MVGIMKFAIKILIHIFLILIIIGLVGRLIVNEKHYDCEQCTVYLRNWMKFGASKNILEANVNLNDMYEGYIKNECPIAWDSSSGFVGDLGNVTVREDK